MQSMYIYPVIIASAVKVVAILLFYDADVQTTLGDYHVLDAPSSVLPERIVITYYFVVLKAGFMIFFDRNAYASTIETKRVITAKHSPFSKILTIFLFLNVVLSDRF